MKNSECSAHGQQRGSVWRRMGHVIASLALVGLLASCGDTDPPSKRLVVFGDSLSDMGSYQVGTVKALGGGRFTVNLEPMWNEIVAAELSYAMTPGMTGGFGIAPSICPLKDNCSNWAQGGARVSQRPGIGYVNDGSGSLSTPIIEQVGLHLEQFGKFETNDIVSIQGGANDVFYQLGALQAMLQAGMSAEEAATAAVTAMGTAGAQLADLVSTSIVGNGAQKVVVWNLVDIAATPFAQFTLDAQTRVLVSTMTLAFNTALSAGLSNTPVTIIDAKALLDTWIASPVAYGFSNTSIPACSAEKIAAATGGLIADGSSLFCTNQTLLDTDTTRFMFADAVHPAPFTGQLMAQTFMNELQKRGWR